MKKALIGTVAALSMLAGIASPAAARPYWGGGGYHHYHRGGGDGFGNFLLGGLLVGGAVAIASSANRDRDSRPVYRSSSVGDVRDAGEEARQVTSICSDAAEGMARGRVTGVDSVGRDGDGWRVEGTVDADNGDRRFSCGTRFGRVDFVQLGDRLALR